jgi:type IV pilus assembly protein PilN
MRIPLNLASEPFRRDRPMIVASISVAVLMAGLLSVLIWLAVAERGEMASTRQAIDRLEAQLRTISAEQSKLETVLRQPRNAEVLERSLFLNELLQRKGISWTRIFSDLEKVMPHNVRLVSVRPEMTPRNEVLLTMQVAAQAREPVIEMVRRLETSELFGNPNVHLSTPPGQNDPLYLYRISVNYAQQL